MRRFFEIFVDTPLAVCESRDVKGLYKKAREGSIQGFTGVTQAYEAPQQPDLVVKTEHLTIRDSTNSIIELLVAERVVPKTVRDIETVPELFVSDAQRAIAYSEAKSLPAISISTVEMQWLQVLAEGWAYPLRGFMREEQYLHVSVVYGFRLDSITYSIPIHSANRRPFITTVSTALTNSTPSISPCPFCCPSRQPIATASTAAVHLPCTTTKNSSLSCERPNFLRTVKRSAALASLALPTRSIRTSG